MTGAGKVIGIDVGFSDTRRSTCFCLLSWDENRYEFHFESARAFDSDRIQALNHLVPITQTIRAVALDGPLAKDLQIVNRYRSAEAILSRGLFQKRGKPGQTNSPTGQQLHCHATRLADQTLAAIHQANSILSDSIHPYPVHAQCVVEAFPTLFLAVLLSRNNLPEEKTRAKSDIYWSALIRTGGLQSYLSKLLPNRAGPDLATFVDHDQRAAIVCALTALCVSVGRFAAVGDPVDGFIVLPAVSDWGIDQSDRVSWAEMTIRKNIVTVRRLFSGAEFITSYS